ncbi:hypothetical protein G6F57_017701 [Rhizopus arrhizus]|uniref:Uncharacterized protein n=1 Tax=Rhizopus delemar TaxID=936053 RepID=A0A9P6XTJ7_9FUNG|nr:hypothetical protein G6F57_017701 [Rhizopus arrhizus]KAG1531874.1 hypothetical protein G6F50_016468 [Rhizopus delemar]
MRAQLLKARQRVGSEIGHVRQFRLRADQRAPGVGIRAIDDVAQLVLQLRQRPEGARPQGLAGDPWRLRIQAVEHGRSIVVRGSVKLFQG